jgi:succinate dehydrogenase flavin-adding protein (antitoxin of CptAB toxin-antitoxin module)
MLELDILLEKFILQGHYAALNHQQLELFAWILEQPDPTLLGWFTGKEQPDDAAVVELVALIRGLDG